MTSKQKAELLLAQLKAAMEIATHLGDELTQNLDDANDANRAEDYEMLCDQVVGALLPIEKSCEALQAICKGAIAFNQAVRS